MATSIYDIYKKRKSQERDNKVLDRINNWISENTLAVSDGLLKVVPVITGKTMDYISAPYGLTLDDIKEMHKSKEWKNMAKLASPQRTSTNLTNPIKLGLIISYADTKNVAFLNFLAILTYSSLMVKYFPNGFDKNIMKYTIDNADARTDFKKYEGSLMVVVNKKVETFLNLFKNKLKPGLSDRDLREALQSLSTRMNEAIKAISTKYYQNFHDPDIKIMIEYSKTDDGKNVISALGVMEAIRQAAVDNLTTPSDRILTMIHLSSRDITNLKYRVLFIKQIPECFGLLSQCTSEMLDDWMKRHPNKVTIKLFRQDFIKTMSKARNIGHIIEILENVTDKMLLSVPEDSISSYNRLEMRKFMYNYVMLNIYASSNQIIK